MLLDEKSPSCRSITISVYDPDIVGVLHELGATLRDEGIVSIREISVLTQEPSDADETNE